MTKDDDKLVIDVLGCDECPHWDDQLIECLRHYDCFTMAEYYETYCTPEQQAKHYEEETKDTLINCQFSECNYFKGVCERGKDLNPITVHCAYDRKFPATVYKCPKTEVRK